MTGATLLSAAELLALVPACAPGVHPTTMTAIVQVESARNPYAIGIVGGRLERQPRNLNEALITAEALEKAGWNYSVGLAQINRHQLRARSLDLRTAFEPCTNLRTSAAILKACYARALPAFRQEQASLRAALSCYYAGNFQRGQRSDGPTLGAYTDRIWQAAARTARPTTP